MRPRTGFAQVGDDRVAYYVYGDGPIDVMIDTGFWGSFDVEWAEPSVRLFYEEIAGFARLIRFDRRGVGASDPVPLEEVPPWEVFADEIEAVLEAVGSKRVALAAMASAGAPGMLFAATRPERLVALIVFQGSARYLVDDDYPAGITPDVASAIAAGFDDWGSGSGLEVFLPFRAADPEFRDWYSRMQRAISSPKAMQRYFESDLNTDARSVLSLIDVPTLILHRRENQMITLEQGRYLAERIPGARLVELPGADVGPFWETPELALEAIEQFLGGLEPTVPPRRKLATVLFTDIVGSTERAQELGDRRWRSLLEMHDDIAAGAITTHGGVLVKTTGDGVLATFDGPGRAIEAALRMTQMLKSAGIGIRVGIHTGEIEVRGEDVGGISVHIASRIMSLAGEEQILVSRTVKDLATGSGFVLEDLGLHALKGIDETWQLYSVSAGS